MQFAAVSVGVMKNSPHIFTKILNINSQELQAWISIGYVYQKMFKFKDALKCYKKAQAIVNGRYTHKLYDGLASCLTKLSEFDQAIECFEKIIEEDPEDSNSYFNLGLAYFKKKDYY